MFYRWLLRLPVSGTLVKPYGVDVVVGVLRPVSLVVFCPGFQVLGTERPEGREEVRGEDVT